MEACAWDEEARACSMPMEAHLLLPGLPSSPWRRATLQSTAREFVCSQLNNSAACNANLKHRCFWWDRGEDSDFSDGPATSCASSDFQELLYFVEDGREPGLTSMPAAMTCPGTKAHEFFSCFSHMSTQPPPCKRMPGCVTVAMGLDRWGEQMKEPCVPRWMVDMRLAEIEAFLEQLDDLAPALWGTCEAACWMAQARACRAAGRNDSRATQAACAKLPYCEMRGATGCVRRLQDLSPASAHDRQVLALQDACTQASTERACLSVALPPESLAADSALGWEDYLQSATPVAKCDAPQPRHRDAARTPRSG